MKIKFKFAKKEWIWWSISTKNPNTKKFHLFSLEFRKNEISGRRSLDLQFLPIHVYIFWFGKKKTIEDEYTVEIEGNLHRSFYTDEMPLTNEKN